MFKDVEKTRNIVGGTGWRNSTRKTAIATWRIFRAFLYSVTPWRINVLRELSSPPPPNLNLFFHTSQSLLASQFLYPRSLVLSKMPSPFSYLPSFSSSTLPRHVCIPFENFLATGAHKTFFLILCTKYRTKWRIEVKVFIVLIVLTLKERSLSSL